MYIIKLNIVYNISLHSLLHSGGPIPRRKPGPGFDPGGGIPGRRHERGPGHRWLRGQGLQHLAAPAGFDRDAQYRFGGVRRAGLHRPAPGSQRIVALETLLVK